MNQPSTPSDSEQPGAASGPMVTHTNLTRSIMGPIGPAWMEWSEEAFQRSLSENKPVFLSIGFRTCHYTDRMHKETFSHPMVKKLLNEYFIPVKLDREVRPDVDAAYQYAAIGAGRSGGWPLSVVLDELRRPFFLAAFMPALDGPNKVGFVTAMQRVLGAWQNRRGSVAEDAERMAAFLKTAESAGVVDEEAKVLGKDTLTTAFTQIVRKFDDTYGGFGHRPKYLPSSTIALLQRLRHYQGGERVNSMVNLTLRRIARGGVIDHVGGGFHRYAVDERWHQPHFGKALYDQARMITTYLEAAQHSSDPFYRKVVRRSFAFVEREMRAGIGPALITAVGSDLGRGAERLPRGSFYTYSQNDLDIILGKDDAQIIASAYGFEEGGNYQDEFTENKTNRNILHFGQRGVSGVGGLAATDPDLVNPRISELLDSLLAHRQKQAQPEQDGKVIAAYNAQMASAYARAAWVFDDQVYAQNARELFDFIWNHLRGEDGELFRCWADGKAYQRAFLDDYANLARASFDLFQLDFKLEDLTRTIEILEDLLGRFSEMRGGALFFAQDETDDLVSRRKEITDERGPNGNALVAELLIRLSRLCDREDFADAGKEIIQGFAREAKQRPSNYPQLMVALELLTAPGQEIIVAVPDNPKEESPPLEAYMQVLRRRFMPRTTIAVRRAHEAAEILELIPFTKRQQGAGGSISVYVCSSQACSAPISDPDSLAYMLDNGDIKARC